MYKNFLKLAALAFLTSACAMPGGFNDSENTDPDFPEALTLVPDQELRNRAPQPDEYNRVMENR